MGIGKIIFILIFFSVGIFGGLMKYHHIWGSHKTQIVRSQSSGKHCIGTYYCDKTTLTIHSKNFLMAVFHCHIIHHTRISTTFYKTKGPEPDNSCFGTIDQFVPKWGNKYVEPQYWTFWFAFPWLKNVLKTSWNGQC